MTNARIIFILKMISNALNVKIVKNVIKIKAVPSVNKDIILMKIIVKNAYLTVKNVLLIVFVKLVWMVIN